MNTIFRSMVGGAAMLIAAGAAPVVAQDYTWTLTDFTFGDWFDSSNVYQGVESNTGASGTMVLTKTAPNTYTMKSFNFTTTFDLFGSQMSAVYDSTVEGGYGAGSPEFDTYVEMFDTTGEYIFHMSWFNAALHDEMNGNNLGAQVFMDPGAGYEYYSDNTIRYSGGSTNPQFCGDGPQDEGINCFGPAGTLTLTDIRTPEPASLALLGTGLLGLFAARRRKAG